MPRHAPVPREPLYRSQWRVRLAIIEYIPLLATQLGVQAAGCPPAQPALAHFTDTEVPECPRASPHTC